MTDYLHTYSATEQQRLLEQARWLRPQLHQDIRISPGERILEIGCGVGAQLKILAEQVDAELVGLDRSSEQLATARQILAPELARGQVTLMQGQAEQIDLPAESFDQVIIFFVLEHLPEPPRVLAEARRVLRPGGRLTVTEVFNSSFYTVPQHAKLKQLWQAYIDLQIDLGGHPDIGIELVNLSLLAGFHSPRVRPVGPCLDRTTPLSERTAVVDFWQGILDSVRPRLLAEARVRPEVQEEAYRQLRSLVDNPDAVIYYAGFQLVAEA